nr:immunoglobulin light chain junction region [Macaca mulatta]MOW17458.1 immunoglobulin light chain junction region [Macaca mulatta]MOW17796.1 immunoglobulin light chain junction region [Macaca mulatta]
DYYCSSYAGSDTWVF